LQKAAFDELEKALATTVEDGEQSPGKEGGK